MAIGITKEQLDRVHALIIDKNVAGAWKLLADFGDRYAEGAYAVIADPTSPYAVMVRTHWENLDADFGKFNTVALRHVQQYVDMIGKAKGQIDGKLADSEVAVEYGNKAPAISVDGLLLLPDTSPIESSYRAAVVGVGLLPQTAIDLVINKAPTAGIEWFGQSPIGLGLEAERISTYRNLPPGMSRGDALALLSRDVMATSYAMYAQAVLGTGHTPAESLIAFRGLSTLFRSGNTIKLETIGAYSYYSNEGTHTAAMIDKGGDGVAWHDGKIIKVSPDNFRKNDKGGFDIRLDNGSWVGAGLDDNRMAPSFAAIEKSKDEVLVRATSGGRLVASLVDHTAGELSYIETTYKGHSEDSGVAAIKTVHGRHHSIFVLDGNASRAPDGVVVGPNQFYIDSKYKTLNAVAKATGGSVSALLGLNTGLALASGSTIIDAGTLIELPKPTHLINIDIKTDPTPQLGSQAEGQAAQDVRNGFVENSATTRVSFSDNTLNRTDFTSTQMGSLATGGVRPGEMELDPNAKPGAHLGRFYIDPVATQNRNAAHMNSAVLNGLSAMTTVNTYIDPILMDLTGRGVKTTGIDNGVLFDIDHSGTVKRTGWADAGTGMLVVNNGNDQITDASQMLSEYFGGKAGSNGGPGETRFKDSFGALESIDTHRDGVIDQNDPIWSKLRVWVDRNHDGKSGPRELKTLEALGITQIQVKPHFSAGEMQNGNEVIARGTFTMKGQTRELMAVNFLADPVGNAFVQVKGGMKVSSTSEGATRTAFTSTRSVKEKLDAAKLGVDNVYAGKGDTTLIAAANGSWLVGGGGSNTYRGGAGDDVFVVSARDNPRNIRGNGGRDTVIIVGDRGMTLNMAQSGLTIAQGGRGDDVILSGGNRSVFIKGGQGHTTMVGGGGNDVLVGGSGQNTIIGGSSRAVIYAGPKGDTIYAAAQGSVIHAGGGADRIFGSERDDVIEAGHGDAIIDGKGGTNVVTLHGNHGDYTVTDTGQGYTVTDHLAGRDGTLTLKNIQKLNFADISVVDLTLPNAMPVSDSLRTDQAGLPFDHTRPHLIAASVLLANDQRLNSQGAWKIASVDDAVGGNVALTAGGDVQFTPDPSYSGVMSFKYSVIDAQGRPAATVVNLNNGQTAPMRAVVTLTTPDVPTDPLAAQQWYLSDANVIPVWHDYTGKGIRIGQFEPGGEFATAPQILDVNHPDLASNIDPVWQTTQQSAKTMPQSVSNHATMVAGVMVAAKNGQGGVGVAYDAKVGGHYLANSGADLTALGKMVGYDIANHSWGFKNDFALSNLQRGRINTESALLGTAQYAAENGRSGLGTIMVAAGGNAREQGGSAQGSLIGNSRFATQVGAINAQGDLSTLQSASVPFSNPGASLLVSAPGSSIVSTSRMLETDRGSTFGNRYDDMQGTSFAAPIVSGIVALMLEANPNLGYRDVQAILALSARKVTDASTQWDVNGAHNWNGGGMHVSHDYGLGAVDARAAVRFAESWMTQSTGANIGVQSASSNALGQSVAAGTTFNSSLTMRDGVRVEHAEIDIDANVGRLGDLIVKLVSPSGTQSILLNRTGKIPAGATGASDADTGSTRSGEFNYTFMSTRHWGERSGGDWKLEVTHAATGEPVTLNNWSLRVYGNTNPDATGYAYFYTDEFAGQAAADPSRAMFDGLADHLPVVSKTIHAAAVSRDTQIDLTTGVASIGGTPLKITHAGAIRNIVTGDGNDVLRASDHQNALLDGGRGTNTLRGGLAGTDCFVVHRRAGGLDTIENFDAPRGELIDLVGFKGKSFKDLEIKQIGLDLAIDLGDSQRVVLKNQNTAALADRHFVFQDTFAVPEAHHRRAAQPAQAETADGMETVVLTGGGGGVGLVGSKVTLTGKVYSHGSGDSDRFVIRHQPDAAHYRNTLRGFRHGVDKIDLSQTGIASFGDLAISKVERMKINGIASIHGVSVAMRAPGVEGEPVELLYLDAMEMAQVTESDFIFAKPGAAPVITTDPVSNPPGTEFVPHPAPSFSTNAAQRIQAVLDKLRPVGPLAVPTVVPDVRPEPVHAPDLIASPAHHRSARALSSDLVHDAPGPIDVPRGYTVDRLIQDKAAFASRPAGAAVFIPPQSHAAQPTLVANLR